MPNNTENNTEPSPKPTAFLENAIRIQKIVEEKSYTLNRLSEEIRHLTDQLLNNVVPSFKYEAARKEVTQWLEKLMLDLGGRFKLLEEVGQDINKSLLEINQYQDKALALTKSMNNDIGDIEKWINDPERVATFHENYSNITPPESPAITDEFLKLQQTRLEIVNDYSSLNVLWAQQKDIALLVVFVDDGKRFLRKARRFFAWQRTGVRALTAITIGVSFLVSFQIEKVYAKGLKEYLEFRYKLNIPEIAVLFVAFLICFFTTDKWLEGLRERGYWNYARKTLAKSTEIYLKLTQWSAAYEVAIKNIRQANNNQPSAT